MSKLNEIAKSKVNIDGWEPYLYEAAYGGGCIVTGCMTTVKTRGKNKGELKFDTKKTKITIVLSKEELQ